MRILSKPADRRSILALTAGLAASVLGSRSGPALATSERDSRIWVCTYNQCEPYRYDPVRGDPDNVGGAAPIPPGTPFVALPHEWMCPVCGAPKEWFMPLQPGRSGG